MKKQNQKHKQSDNDLRSFWTNLWFILKPSHKQIKGLLVLTIVFELARLIGPYILKIIIDKLVNFNPAEITFIVLLIVLMFFSEEFNSLINYFRDKKIFKMLINIEYYLTLQAQKKLVFLSLSYHERENTGNKIIKIERGVNKINELLVNMSWEVVPTLWQLFITWLVLLAVDWRFGLSFLLFAPLFIWITYKVNKDLAPIRKQWHKDYEVASGKMGQSIININTVQSFVQEAREVKEFSDIRARIKISETKGSLRLLKVGLTRNLIIDLGRITILLLGVYLVWYNQVTIGTLVFVITLSEKAYLSLFRLSRFYDKAEEGAGAVKRLIDLTREKENIANPKNGIIPKNVNGQIEFRDVCFDYNAGIASNIKNSDWIKRKALKNVNLKIDPGNITALVGPSGGGKTTVVRMIYRHYDPQAGAILLDGRNLREYDLYNFRKFIAIVPQEVEIFDLSVRDNISYAKARVSFAEIKKAARIANAEEFIKDLSDGYDTLVGERGIKLSGGQRQRIGIARAILVNPRILIFDEATSNLDSYSEKLIQEAMDKISRGRTTIMIAHRLSTIQKADKIIVLEDGEVVEQGSHDELVKVNGGLYAKLLKLQAMGEVD